MGQGRELPHSNIGLFTMGMYCIDLVIVTTVDNGPHGGTHAFSANLSFLMARSITRFIVIEVQGFGDYVSKLFWECFILIVFLIKMTLPLKK